MFEMDGMECRNQLCHRGRGAFGHYLEISVLSNALTLTRSSSSTSISSHWHGLFMSNHIAQIRKGAIKFPSVDGLGGFAGVFEGDAEVSTAGAGRLARFDVGGCVTDLDRGRERG